MLTLPSRLPLTRAPRAAHRAPPSVRTAALPSDGPPLASDPPNPSASATPIPAPASLPPNGTPSAPARPRPRIPPPGSSDAIQLSSMSDFYDTPRPAALASAEDTRSLVELDEMRSQLGELRRVVESQQMALERMERELSHARASSSGASTGEGGGGGGVGGGGGGVDFGSVGASGTLGANGVPGLIMPDPQPPLVGTNGGAMGQPLLTGPVKPTVYFGPSYRPLEPGAPLADPWPRKNFSRPLDLQARLAYAGTDRRPVGFDARFHSTSPQATPKDFRILPARIILVRHGESEGNVDNQSYSTTPDNRIPLTEKGFQQAVDAGRSIRRALDQYHAVEPYNLYFYISPYTRSLQTYLGIRSAFPDDRVAGVQEEVQLREQDFGNFQDPEGKKREKAERLRFGRFFYRFPNGESGADCYDRITGFQDHMIRDINAGRFARNTSLVLVTHGLALRIFLMRWFHWTIDQFLNVYNPPNAEPLFLERNVVDDERSTAGSSAWVHTKALYTLSDDSRKLLKGVNDDMCRNSLLPKGIILRKADDV